MTDEQKTNHAFARSRSNAGLGGEKCFANMNFGFGNTNSWLEIKKYDDEIFFVRDADGVHAWHCGSLPITDRRILEIRTLPPLTDVLGTVPLDAVVGRHFTGDDKCH